MTSKEKVDVIVAIADDMKAEQIETLDVHDKTSVADYFVVCTATNDRHGSEETGEGDGDETRLERTHTATLLCSPPEFRRGGRPL